MDGPQHIHNSLKCHHYIIYAPSNLFSITVMICLLQIKYSAWPEDIPVSRNKDVNDAKSANMPTFSHYSLCVHT